MIMAVIHAIEPVWLDDTRTTSGSALRLKLPMEDPIVDIPWKLKHQPKRGGFVWIHADGLIDYLPRRANGEAQETDAGVLCPRSARCG